MKRSLTLFTSALCLAILSLPAQAHLFSNTSATPVCDGPDSAIKLTFDVISMQPDRPFYVEYKLTLGTTAGIREISLKRTPETTIDLTDPPGDVAGYDFSIMATEPVPELGEDTVTVTGWARLYQYENLGDLTAKNWHYRDFMNEDLDTEFDLSCPPSLGSLGDYVWIDDGDGLFESNELPKPDVTVYLGTPDSNALGGCAYDDDPNSPTASRKETTGADGSYLFDNLEVGEYCVVFEKPDGFTCTTANVDDPNSDAIDSDGVSFGDFCITGEVSLGQGENDWTVDLGLVQTASLGDRVWYDFDGDGVQDCDSNTFGSISLAADASPNECLNGIDDVTVTLGKPSGSGANYVCDTTLGGGRSTMTEDDGFYSFSGLDADETVGYCVSVDLNTVNLSCALGSALFTVQNQSAVAGEGADSDVNAGGDSDSVTLAAGATDLTIDAGVVCPVKIGDRVWIDDDGLGTQDNTEENVEGATVKLFTCAGEFVADTTTVDGMYMFGGFGATPELAPGCYVLEFTDSETGRPFTLQNADDADSDSDCDAAGTTDQFTVLPNSYDDSLDCGVVPPGPVCDLTIAKGCQVLTPPAPAFEGSCKGKLKEFSLVWTGAETVTVAGPDGVAKSVDPDGVVTITEPSGGFDDNDVVVNFLGTDQSSVFHVSCSDDDFDDPEDCFAPAGNGKGDDDSKGLNDWLLAGFVDAEDRVLDCGYSSEPEGPYTDTSCTFFEPVPPSCETSDDKPEMLTWRYDGGICADSTFVDLQGDDFKCEIGDVDATLAITVLDDKDGSNTLTLGDEFTISRDASKKMLLQQGGQDAQYLEAHMSCSQPIVVGATAGALTLVALDGQDGGVDVSYSYTVTNSSGPLDDIVIIDNPLGQIGLPFSLDEGEDYTAYATNTFFGDGKWTNTATAESATCISPTSEVVTVKSEIPPCDIGIYVYDVADDALKLKLTNNDSRNRIATLEEVVITYPADRGVIKEVKLDGDIYKYDDVDDGNYPTSTTASGRTTVTIAESNWTKADLSKRQLDPGEERTLEIKTFGKTDKEDVISTFDVILRFAGDCEYSFTVTYADKKTMLQFP